MLFAGFGSGSHLSIPVPRPNVFRRSFAAFEPLSLPCPAQTCQKMRCFLQKNKICARIGIFAPPLAATRNPGKKKKAPDTAADMQRTGKLRMQANTVQRQQPSGGKGASRLACLVGFGVRLAAGLPDGKDSRAPPCTRKGFPPLTRIAQNLRFASCSMGDKNAFGRRQTINIDTKQNLTPQKTCNS